MIFSGIRAIKKKQEKVPELYEGERAVRLGWLWIRLGTLFILAVIFDIPLLKTLFRIFLEAAKRNSAVLRKADKVYRGLSHAPLLKVAPIFLELIAFSYSSVTVTVR